MEWVVFVLIILAMLVFCFFAQFLARNKIELITIRYGFTPQCTQIDNIFSEKSVSENMTAY